jgi:hypothetical protein
MTEVPLPGNLFSYLQGNKMNRIGSTTLLKFLACILLLAAPLLSQPKVTVTGPAANVKAGTSFTMNVALSGMAGSNEASFQFSLPISWAVQLSASSTLTALGKQISCVQVSGYYTCVVYGLNTTALADMVVATLTITVPKTAPGGNVAIGFSNLVAAAVDATGKATEGPLTASLPFSLNITNANGCDLNSDGTVNSVDASLIANQIINRTCTFDLNADGKCTVVDLQIVAQAVTSGVCLDTVAGALAPPRMPTKAK